ncbi:DNA repair protein RadA [Buchananella hordeovulneris]|uniref:DNA repair protein RadA n=1 Tax=Buchananella hordeovulneris TaxID=52770 RepID=UPI0026DB47C8|nr:DNA repair protein RadA [Buchananella hordeovulneris]MDO5081328.1 DNA repair protein RadA [Buchananella hordeovulneris]
MARTSSNYACNSCGAKAVKWAGRCARCGEYGTITESTPPGGGSGPSLLGSSPARTARPVREVGIDAPQDRISTGLSQFDRIVGGGLVPGQVLLLSGEPGAGKSTLLLTIAHQVAARTGQPVLYLSGEESTHQIAVRARRIGADAPSLLVADDTELSAIIGHLDETGPDLAFVIVDSVQTIASQEVEGRVGGVAQVMAVAGALTRVAKSRGIPVCLVGQVTKESTVAGPRALEHVVDTTLSLEGDRHTSLRLLRTVKNRFGPADEVACFEQTDTGLQEVLDPSHLFRSAASQPIAGTCVTVTVAGRRPLLAEIQALVAPSTVPNPRRGVSGLESARAAMLLAVTERQARLKLADKDLFLATVGGMTLRDPAADLALCLAVASAARDAALPHGLAALGEVTLAGEVRSVPLLAQRVAEAMRLGQQRILVPPGATAKLPDAAARAAVSEVSTLADALRAIP